jgi:hypothetical protein
MEEVDKKENSKRFHPLPKLAENFFKVSFLVFNSRLVLN